MAGAGDACRPGGHAARPEPAGTKHELDDYTVRFLRHGWPRPRNEAELDDREVRAPGERLRGLWGDWDGVGQPTTQRDRIYGGPGTDFVYGSHGRNTIYAGKGNDVISVHFGRGFVDCGPGRDAYNVARIRRRGYRFVNCERVDPRSERQRGGGLRPLR